MVESRRLELLGDRAAWEYQAIPLPGAGRLQVNLAGGNLHYAMTDAAFPARRWDDLIGRVYDSRSDEATHLGPGWTRPATPRLRFQDGGSRVVYAAADGGQYQYLEAGGYWRGELGMHTVLTKPNTAPDKVWKLRDLYGATLYFNAEGRPTRKEDKDGSDANTWTWSYSNGEIAQLTGSTGRTQTFTVDANHKITRIRLANPSPDGTSRPRTSTCHCRSACCPCRSAARATPTPFSPGSWRKGILTTTTMVHATIPTPKKTAPPPSRYVLAGPVTLLPASSRT